MSSSYSTEEELRETATKLHQAAADLEQAADVLQALRETETLREEVARAKESARSWFKRWK